MKSLANLTALFSLWLLFVFGCASPNRSRPTTEANSTPALELIALNWVRSSESHVRVNGEVRNISSDKLHGVFVVVEFRDSNGTLITSSDAVIEYPDLMPGQTSPFTVMESFNPLMANYDVKFKHVFGEIIPHVDRVPPQPTPKGRKKK